MDFFERQHQVRRLSWQLMLLFAVAVVGIVAVVDVVAVAVVAWNYVTAEPGDLITTAEPGDLIIIVVVMTSLVTGAVIGLASLERTVGLRRGGGGAVASQLGGVRVRRTPPTRTCGVYATSSRRWLSPRACRCPRSTCCNARLASMLSPRLVDG